MVPAVFLEESHMDAFGGMRQLSQEWLGAAQKALKTNLCRLPPAQGGCSTAPCNTNHTRDGETLRAFSSTAPTGTTRTETPSAKPEPGTKMTHACHTTCGRGPDLHRPSPAACQGSTRSGSVPVCVPAAMVSARLLAASGDSRPSYREPGASPLPEPSSSIQKSYNHATSWPGIHG